MLLNVFEKKLTLLFLFLILLLSCNNSFTTVNSIEISKPKVDIKFGEKQMIKMLADRPAMEGYVQVKDKVWNMIASMFSNRVSGRRILWSNESIDKDYSYLADHSLSNNCYIRLREFDKNNNSISGECLWSSLIYELYNIENDEKFKLLHLEAINGRLSKQKWITENTKLEYAALKKTNEFYDKFWLPLMKKRGIESDSSDWRNGIKPTYEEWISQYDTGSIGDYSYWSVYFDRSIAPFVKN